MPGYEEASALPGFGDMSPEDQAELVELMGKSNGS